MGSYSEQVTQVHAVGAHTPPNSTETADHIEPVEGNSEQFDMTFPVEVGDGRRLTIAWNRSDCPADVARKFAQAHDIASDELPTIEAFVLQSHLAANLKDAELQRLLSEQEG